MQRVDSGKFEQLSQTNKNEQKKFEQNIQKQLQQLDLGLDKIQIEGFEESKERVELHPRDILDDDISEVDLEEL